MTCVAIAVCASVSAGIAPGAEAQTRAWVGATPFEWPFVVATQDPEKPMCVGVQTTVWGDGKGNYTGPCRYGAPLGPMQATLKHIDRRAAVGRVKEFGFPDSRAPKLQIEIDAIARLPFTTGVSRLKRHATNETRAAQGKGDAKPSWLKRAAVNCALGGAIAGTVENALSALIQGTKPDSGTVKAMAAGCATAVISPPLNKWIKSKGYDMEA